MNHGFSSSLPTPLRRRGEIVGIACGVLCLPIGFLLPLFGRTGTSPSAVVLPLVFVSILAGLIGCRLPLPANEASSGFRPRVGIRAGWIAAVFAGAVTVTVATIRALGGAGAPIESGTLAPLFSIMPAARPFAVLALALIGIPPAIFFGLSGAVIAGMRRLPPAGGAKSAPSQLTASPAFLAILFLSALGYLSPFVVLLRPTPKPVAVAQSTPAPISPVSTPPPVPKWRYVKPAGFETAGAEEIIVSDIRNLGELDPGLPFAISPDERRFAFFSRSAELTMEVRDLDTLDHVARVNLQKIPDALSWSPDGGKIIILTVGEQRLFEVIDVANGRVVTLPKPIGSRVPEGRIAWLNPEQVFLRGNPEPQILHLDTLRILPAKESAVWNAVPKDKRGSLILGSEHLPRNASRIHGFKPAVFGYSPGEPSGKPTRVEHLHVAFNSPATHYERSLPELDLNIDDLLLGTADGTKIIRIRNREAAVFYLSLRQKPPLTFSLNMPGPPDDALAAKVEKKTLCVFICAPLTNPLNGKAVGPDRSKVKGLARILSWNDTHAELWIAEDYSHVLLGDIASDLHVWNDGNPDYVEKFQKDDWFSDVEDLRTVSPPKKKDTEALARGLAVSVDHAGSGDRVTAISARTFGKPNIFEEAFGDPFGSAPTPKPMATPMPRPAATPLPVLDVNKPMVYVPATPAPPKATPVDNAAVIRRFMTEHTAKINRGDTESFAKDFTNPVEYLGNTNTRAEISNALRGGLARRLNGYHETLVSMEVRQLSPTTVEVLTTIQHSNAVERSQGKNTRQSLGYIVEITPSGPQITKFTDMGR